MKPPAAGFGTAAPTYGPKVRLPKGVAPYALPAPRGPRLGGTQLTGRDVAKADAILAAAEPATVVVAVPVRTVNPTNGLGRGKFRERIGRAAREREATLAALGPHADKRERLAAGCVVTLTRVSSGKLSAWDGLGPALKHVRDAVGMWLLGGRPGERDEDPRITWSPPRQKNLGRGVYGVLVAIQAREGVA